MAVDKLVDSAQLNSDLEDIADAIRTKGGTSAQLAFPNEFVSAINAIPTGGGGGVEEKQINFVDYDGTILHSYTKAEINAMSSESDLPANPSHTGLTAQGWHWTLAQIKAQLTAMPDGPVWVGQMYTTADGKTRIYISIPSNAPSSACAFAVRFKPTVSSGVTIDWGDDSTSTSNSTNSKSYSHTYASPGDYVVTLNVTSGTAVLGDNNSYGIVGDALHFNYVIKVEVGASVSIGQYTFYKLYKLKSLTLPNTVTFSSNGRQIHYCYSLKCVVIPAIANLDLPTSFLDTSRTIEKIILPGTTKTIATTAFANAYGLEKITIPYGVTSIGSNVFQNCISLKKVVLPLSITSLETGLFRYDSAFGSEFVIPSSVTSIGSNVFQENYAMVSLTIPSNVTSIGSNAFASCTSVRAYHLLPTSPPSLANTNAFTSLNPSCVFYVPYSEDHSILNAYKTASNWSTYASKMQEEPQ